MLKSNLSKIKNILIRINQSDLEYYEEQFMYGHREILLNYFIKKEKLRENFIIEGSIDHAWAYDENLWKLRKRNLKKSNRYVWNERQQTLLMKLAKTTAVGSPWIYLLDSLGLSKNKILTQLPKTKNKVLIIPGHNAIDSNKDFKKTIEDLKNVASFSQNVIVSLYWIDYLDPQVRSIYRDLGWEVVCAGYVPRKKVSTSTIGGRQNFLLEFFDYAKDVEFIITDDFSTGALYALSLGAKIIYIPLEESINHMEIQRKFRMKKHNDGFFGTPNDWILHYKPELLNTLSNPKMLIDFAWNELGEKSFHINKGKNKIIWKSSKLDNMSLRKYQKRLLEIKSKI
jgi:hypothetical protein